MVIFFICKISTTKTLTHFDAPQPASGPFMWPDETHPRNITGVKPVFLKEISLLEGPGLKS